MVIELNAIKVFNLLHTCFNLKSRANVFAASFNKFPLHFRYDLASSI